MQSKFYLPFLTLVGLTVRMPDAIAQTYQPGTRPPVADNTLGTNVSLNGNNFNITGGLSRGQILFHSFNDFSVPTNSAANFIYNPTVTRDIISRVTGSSFSDINGLINSSGANFFLINPNGITFGPSASLNVGRAFVASTANGINLVDGTGRTFTFVKSGAGDGPLLSVNSSVLFNPSQLVMSGGNGQINNFGTLQTNNPSQYIGLIGGNVNINDGQINAPGGRIELGGLSEFGTVILGSDVNNLKAQLPSNVARGDVSLTNGAIVNVAGSGGGDIAINARNVEISGGSSLNAGIAKNLGTSTTLGGDIKINATGKITLDSSLINNQLDVNANGSSGNIGIDTGSLSLNNGSQLLATAYGSGKAGDIQVKAKDAISILGNSTISSRIAAGGDGSGGNIDIMAGSFSLKGSFVGTPIQGSSGLETPGRGNSGDISIKVTGSVDITGNGIFTNVGANATGNSGNISIKANSISLRDGARLSTSILGMGRGGNISLSAKDSVDIDGFKGLNELFDSGITTAIGPESLAGSGNVYIDASSIYLHNGAQLSTSTFGNGNAGSVNLLSLNNIFVLYGSLITSSPEKGAIGRGGNINIATVNFFLDSSLLRTTTSANGDAGNVTINTLGAVNIAGNKDGFSSAITTNVEQGAIGNGGNIKIDASSISLRDGAQLLATTSGQGKAGNINFNATDFVTFIGSNNGFSSGLFVSSLSPIGTAGDIFVTSPKLTLDNGGKINAESLSGNGGNIQIGGILPSEFTSIQGSQINPNKTELLVLRNGAKISTNASGTPQQGGNGGNININSDFIVAIPQENSDISANAVKGRGGNVTINSQGLFGIGFRDQSTNNSDITASSDFGQSGNVNITTPGTDPGKDSTQLPNVPNDASNQISQVCSANTRDNKLTVTGRGGLPPNANDTLNVDVVWQDARAAQRQPTPSSATTTNPFKLAPPAVGWVFDGKGKVTLIAASTQGQPTGTSVACPNQK
jgi:filamentous hemagglutinin family protein